jgi:molybdate transport system substrate-binding protein
VVRGKAVAVLLSAMVVVACGASRSASASWPGGSSSLVVAAAASLRGPLEGAESAWEAAHPGSALTVSIDSSAALETQIELGAPVDVFLSADTTNAQKLVDRGLTGGELVRFATNELTVIVPAGNPAAITAPADLAKPGIKVIAAGEAVPITGYATQLVSKLAAETGDPAGFDAAYVANIVSREDNVKAIVAKLELGEGDAGIVYVTDARASSRVKSIQVPPAAGVRATYAGVMVAASRNPAAAREFLAWIAGPEGQAILGEFGFLPPP